MNRVRTFTHTPHIEDTLLCSFTHSVYTGLQLHTFCLFINAILATVTIADTFHWITKGVNAQAAEKCHHLCFFKLPVNFWIHFKFSESPQIWERLSLCSWPWHHWAVFERATQSPEWGGHQQGETSKARTLMFSKDAKDVHYHVTALPPYVAKFSVTEQGLSPCMIKYRSVLHDTLAPDGTPPYQL